MENNYEHNGYKIIVDFIKDGQVFYRKFQDKKYAGAYRMPEAEFRQELECKGLKINDWVFFTIGT